MKSPKIYALVEVNPLLSANSKRDACAEQLDTCAEPANACAELPDALRKYADVFSTENAGALPPNREGINLAIKI